MASRQFATTRVEGTAATCPAGSHAVSGGGYVGLANLADSKMTADHQSWILVVVNETSISTHLEAAVYCAGAGQAVAARVSGAANTRAMREAHAIAARIARERHAAGH
jgi:hypothetical protein